MVRQVQTHGEAHWWLQHTEDAIEHLFCSHLEQPLGLHVSWAAAGGAKLAGLEGTSE
jgi:hypothetical protein